MAVKSLRNNSSDRDCSDFIKEIKNMVKLQSKTPGSPYVIKLRGVSQGTSELFHSGKEQPITYSVSFRAQASPLPPSPGGWGYLIECFEYVPLASQNPWPIIVYFVAVCGPHVIDFWPNVNVAIPT